MRYALALSVLAFALSACAITRPAKDSQLREVEHVEQHDLTQDEAFTRLVRWAAETYNSANDVIQLQDREAGAIVAKGGVQPAGSTQLMFYTMTMDVRDGRVRFRQRPGDSRDVGGGFDYMSEHDANLLHEHFDALRASAMAAIAEEDDF